MARAEIKFLVGSPLAGPANALYDSLYNGTITSVSTTKFVIVADDGAKTVFRGDFTVVGGEVTGGTVTGFDVFAGATKTMKASDYDIDAAAFFDAVQDFPMDSSPLFDLLDDQPQKIIGSNSGDQASGSQWDDVLVGRDGADYLTGWDGNDTIKGGKGADFIAGEGGADTLKGGEGDDVFVFVFNILSPPPEVDKIVDFKHGKDHIGLTPYDGMGLVLPIGALDGKYFHKGKEAKTADDHVIYDKHTGKVYFDVDGSGGEAQFAFAKLKAGTQLTADDFYIGSSLLA